MIISGLTAYIDRTFDEALALAREVRDYLRNYGEEESQKIAIDIAAHYSVEIMCQTSRLTNMLAWLLVPRAIHQGALSHEEVRKDNWRPGGSDVCLKESAIDPERLPPYLCGLLRRSERLSSRITRLDEMVAGEPGQKHKSVSKMAPCTTTRAPRFRLIHAKKIRSGNSFSLLNLSTASKRPKKTH